MFINLMFFLVSLVLLYNCRALLQLLGISGDFLDQVSVGLPLYGFTVGTLLTLTNVLRGKMSFIYIYPY